MPRRDMVMKKRIDRRNMAMRKRTDRRGIVMRNDWREWKNAGE